MALSRQAAEIAAEIRLHDWSDAPYRADRAGHQRSFDGNNPTIPQLSPQETDVVRLNVMWVNAQVLAYSDPNFNVYEFAEACRVNRKHIYTSRGTKNGMISCGLRLDAGGYHRPGTYSSEPAEPSAAGVAATAP
jgi:hypothetical protein